MPMERTLILVKPDAMQRGLAGEILARLERRGLRIAGKGQRQSGIRRIHHAASFSEQQLGFFIFALPDLHQGKLQRDVGLHRKQAQRVAISAFG